MKKISQIKNIENKDENIKGFVILYGKTNQKNII